MTDEDSPDEEAWGLIDPQTGERKAIDPESRRKSAEFLTSIPGALEYLEAESARICSRPPTITLSPEYSVEVPLWPQGGETDALVSEGLVAKLTAWQHLFAANFEPSGWTSQNVRQQWLEQAVVLEAELREVVAGRVEVEVDLWPVNPGFLHTSQLDRPPPT